MLNEQIDDILADLIDDESEWRKFLQALHEMFPYADFEIRRIHGEPIAYGSPFELPADLLERLEKKVQGITPVRIGLRSKDPLYGMQLPKSHTYLLVAVPDLDNHFKQEDWFVLLLQHAVKGVYLKHEMRDLELENQQLFRQIEALKNQHTKLLEDNYSQYLLIQEKEKDYSRKLEREIAKKTAKLQEANASLKEASRLKSEFLANMSHELRTPMNAIVGFSDLLTETPMNKEQIDYVKTICNSADSLLNLINGILDLAKIEAGKMELEIQIFNLREMVKELTSMFRVSTRGKSVNLNCYIDASIPSHVNGDVNRLRQVLVNLIGNAMKFTALGRVDVHAAVTKKTKKKYWVTFSVQDTGIGIPEERLNAIFDKFTQADGSTTRRYGGTGLGLAIYQQLVKLMGGKISLKSVPGEGSEFTFTIPVEEAEAQLEETAKEVMEQNGSEGSDTQRAVNIRVLLVEDNLVNQKLATIILQKQGCKVQVANDGIEALDALKRHAFDLILMDIQMPNLDGIEATQRIREIEKKSEEAVAYRGLAGRKRPIKIVGLTAHARKEDEQDCLNAGMDSFLTKPIMKEKLGRVILDELEEMDSALKKR